MQNAKVMNGMKRALDGSNSGAHHEGAKCIVMLSNCLVDVHNVDANDTSASNKLSGAEVRTDGPNNVNE